MTTFFRFQNLHKAYLDCRKRKTNTLNHLKFAYNLEENLLALEKELTNQTYSPGRSVAFVVQKPKIREIFAANFRDRVVHHLLYNYLSPIFEKIFSYDSWACRKGKGTHRAMFRLKKFLFVFERERERERARFARRISKIVFLILRQSANCPRNIRNLIVQIGRELTTTATVYKLILGTFLPRLTIRFYLTSFAKKLKTKRFFGLPKESFFMTAPETSSPKFKALKPYLTNCRRENHCSRYHGARVCQSAI